jgi:hypothetical protein
MLLMDLSLPSIDKVAFQAAAFQAVACLGRASVPVGSMAESTVAKQGR